MHLKKFPNESSESIRNFSDSDEISQHLCKVISFYDDAIEYIKTLPSFHIGYSFATQKLVELALLHTSFNNKSILEIGCGLGTSLNYLTSTFNLKYVGIDINQKQIDFLTKIIHERELSEKASVIALNALEINNKLGKFDIVWSEDSFSHIPNRSKLFKNIYSSLNKNGILVFSDLVKKTGISEDELTQQQNAWSLWNLETRDTYLNLMHEADFVILDCQDEIGRILLREHIKIDIESGDNNYKTYLQYLVEERDKLINEWGIFNYTRRFERLKTYEYLENGKLDYNFYVAIKR